MITGLGRYTSDGTSTPQCPYHRLLPPRILLVQTCHTLILIFQLLYGKVNVLSNLLPDILLRIMCLMLTFTPPFELFLLLFSKNLFPGITPKQAVFPIGSRQ